MASKQVGTDIDENGIQLTGDIWTLNNVARECMQTYMVPYPGILSIIDYSFPLGSVANNSFPNVKLTERQLTQRQHGTGNPEFAELKLKFEQTTPDEDEDPPEDTLVEYGGTEEISIAEHPQVKEFTGVMFTWLDPETRSLFTGFRAHELDIPEELWGISTYLSGNRQVVRTEYSATKFSSLNINVTEDPPGDYGDSGHWRVTSGSTGNSGRWYVRTRTYTYKPDVWPSDVYDIE